MSRRKNKTTVELQAAADHVEQEIAKLLRLWKTSKLSRLFSV